MFLCVHMGILYTLVAKMLICSLVVWCGGYCAELTYCVFVSSSVFVYRMCHSALALCVEQVGETFGDSRRMGAHHDNSLRRLPTIVSVCVYVCVLFSLLSLFPVK